MEEQEYGKIIHIGSTAGISEINSKHQAHGKGNAMTDVAGKTIYTSGRIQQ